MERIDDREEDDEIPLTPLQALGLHRVGQPLPQRPPLSKPPALNKRGMPARIRKKNPMYFDETLISSTKSPRGSPRKPPKSQGNTPKKVQARHSPPPPSREPTEQPHSSQLSHSEATKVAAASTELLSPSSVSSNNSSSSSLKNAPLKQENLSDASPDSSPPHTPSYLEDSHSQYDFEPPNMMKLNLDSSCASSKSAVSIIKAPAAKSSLTEAQKSDAQHNGARLRNFLKLPQAHKWIYYEWFYANIDRPLFLGPNDFEQVMSEAFPRLKSRRMSRRQWSIVRRCMGKPRRCSQAFFDEELASLAKRRQVLRLLQQRKITDIDQLRDLPFSLPSMIPSQLVIGTRVTARIRKPENGLYTGRIGAVDTSNNTYRITFSNGIGTHSIPDYEVLSCDPPEMIPKESFQQKFRPRPPMGLMTPPRPILPRDTPSKCSILGLDSPEFITNNPLLSQAPRHTPTSLGMGDTIGDYPVESLMHIVQLWKVLESKADKVAQLDQLNSDAEKIRCTGETVSSGFQRKYATIVIDVDNLNEQLNLQLLHVNAFCQEISGGACEATHPKLLPSQIQERCMAEAVAVVQVSNSATPEPVTDKDALTLVTSLTALMLQIKNLGENEVSAFELASLQATLNSIRQDMEDKEMFRDLVDVPLTHIMAAASQLGPLNAFSA